MCGSQFKQITQVYVCAFVRHNGAAEVQFELVTLRLFVPSQEIAFHLRSVWLSEVAHAVHFMYLITTELCPTI